MPELPSQALTPDQRRALGIELDRLLGAQLARLRRRFLLHGIGISLLLPAAFALLAFAPALGDIDDVIVEERGRVDELDRDGESACAGREALAEPARWWRYDAPLDSDLVVITTKALRYSLGMCSLIGV